MKQTDSIKTVYYTIYIKWIMQYDSRRRQVFISLKSDNWTSSSSFYAITVRFSLIGKFQDY